MSQIVLYGLKTCDTCRRAEGDLKRAGHAVVFEDIRAFPGLARKLPDWLAAIGPETLVNRRSTTWRGLSDAEKEQAAGAGAAALLAAHPTLIKRPVIEADGRVFCGWTREVAAALG